MLCISERSHIPMFSFLYCYKTAQIYYIYSLSSLPTSSLLFPPWHHETAILKVILLCQKTSDNSYSYGHLNVALEMFDQAFSFEIFSSLDCWNTPLFN